MEQWIELWWRTFVEVSKELWLQAVEEQSAQLWEFHPVRPQCQQVTPALIPQLSAGPQDRSRDGISSVDSQWVWGELGSERLRMG